MAAVAPHQSMVDLANQLADAAAVITSRYFRCDAVLGSTCCATNFLPLCGALRALLTV